MKKANMLFGFLLLVVATPAIAGAWHEATKATQEEAMQAATKLAKDRAERKRTCYKPAWIKQVVESKPCEKVEGGVKCWATSADRYGNCEKGKKGWLSAGDPNDGWSIPPIPVYPELPSIPRPNTSAQ